MGTVHVGRCTDIEMAKQLWSGTHGPAARMLVNKIRTTIAMKVTALYESILNLQSAHGKSLPPSGARRRMELEYQDWTRVQAAGPHTGGYRDHRVGRQSC